MYVKSEENKLTMGFPRKVTIYFRVLRTITGIKLKRQTDRQTEGIGGYTYTTSVSRGSALNMTKYVNLRMYIACDKHIYMHAIILYFFNLFLYSFYFCFTNI